MKLSGAAALQWVRRPDPGLAGGLIHGDDLVRVGQRRSEATAALIGPQGEAEMRLTRLSAADLRSDPAALIDALKAIGFFPGPRAVWVEDATDGLSGALGAALTEWKPGDATMIVTARQLPARSALRKLFEAAPKAIAIAIYDDPPGPEEVDALLTAAGLPRLAPDAREHLMGLARGLDPAAFRQTIEKLGLYKRGDPSPVTPEEIAALAPALEDGDVDALLALVAEGRMAEIGPALVRLRAQGAGGAVSLCIAATRFMRQVHAVAANPDGSAPVYGPMRDRLLRGAKRLGRNGAEFALDQLIETDLILRSGAPVPAEAVLDRCLLRIAGYRGRG